MINDNKEPLLDVEHISIQFGGLKAVDDFSIKIEEGQIVGLIGPNGAGKTTVFNLLTGVYEPTPTTDEKGRDLGVGHVKINGKKIPNKLKPHQLVDYGLARTFQNIRLFKQMTVLDNVMVAFNHSMKTNIFSNRPEPYLQMNYSYFVLDFGVPNAYTFSEFLRCGLKYCVCSYSPWKRQQYDDFYRHYNKNNELHHTHVKVLGNYEIKDSGNKNCETIPFLPNPFQLAPGEFTFFDRLLERN